MGFKFKLKSKQLDTTSMQTLVDFFYPVGSFYVQFPDANNNTASTAFPTTKYPATLLGGTWTAQWNTVPTFFSTQGDFHASEAETAGRTDGLQTGQILAHWHGLYATGVIGVTGGAAQYYWDGSVGKTTSTNGGVKEAVTDGTHGMSSGYANRPQNRLFIIWKRTS